MASTSVLITHDSEATGTIQELVATSSTDPKIVALALSRFFEAAASGARNASFELEVDASLAYASGTVTCATVVQDNTVTINGVTLTARNTPSGESQFKVESGNTLQATTLAAAINANTSLNTMVRATSSAAVVTVRAIAPGVLGNAVTLASSGATLAVSGARLSGGAGLDAVRSTYSLGK